MPTSHPAPIAAALAACLTLPALAQASLAHAVLDRREAPPNASYRGAVRITHGCEGSPTTSVRITIPEGVVNAKPMPKPGWTLSTARGPYARSYPSYHGQVEAGVKEIVWSGGPLPDDQFDEFTFTALLTDAFPPGAQVFFPVVQECERGSHHWTQVPGPGQGVGDLRSPAPSVRIVPVQAVEAPPGAPSSAAIRAGSLTLTQPWTRATPGGAKVAGGYLRITNAGPEPDRLVGGSFPIAGRVEVHEMAAEGGIMRMRPIEGGLVIRPGETVDLRPGGHHLMLMELSTALREGEPLKGTLVFERAGPVEVTFAVGRIGATQPPGEHSPH